MTRTPPHSEDSEMAVLGCILLAADRVMDLCVRIGVTVNSFYVQWHRHLYAALLEMHEKREIIDILTVSQKLRSLGTIDQIGGNAYIERLVDATPTQAHAEYYIAIIREKELRRSLIESAREVAESAYDDTATETAEELISRTQAKFSSFVIQKEAASMKDVALAEIAKWESDEYRKSALRWPWVNLNEAIGPLTDEYVIVAAQPSVGKTAFALNVATYHARMDRKVSILSLESKKNKVAQRLLAQIGRVNTLLLRTNRGTPEEFQQAREAAEKLDSLDLHVHDEGMTVDQIRAWAHAEKHRGSNLLIIDNMKHVRVKQAYKNRFDLFAEVSLQLKFIRDDTGLPLMALHHLNADDKLAWSSDIERDADIILVMALNEDNTILPTQANSWRGKWMVDISCLKNREGTTGDVSLEFVKKYQLFEEEQKPLPPPAKQVAIPYAEN